MKAIHSIDMERTKCSKLLADLPPVDVLITMGCNVNCPFLPCKERYDWGLDDPTGKDDTVFITTINCIEQKIKELAESLSC